MITMIAAAVLAAQPAAPAPVAAAKHDMHMQMAGDHEGMDCCKHCCEDMKAKQEGQNAEHSEHNHQ